MSTDTPKVHFALYMCGTYNIALLVLLWGALQNYFLLDQRLQEIELVINSMSGQEHMNAAEFDDINMREHPQDIPSMSSGSNLHYDSDDDDVAPPGDKKPNVPPSGDNQRNGAPNGDNEPNETPSGDNQPEVAPTGNNDRGSQSMEHVYEPATEHIQFDSSAVSDANIAVEVAARGSTYGRGSDVRQTIQDKDIQNDEPIYQTLRSVLPKDRRYKKGLVSRLSVAIFENTASVVRLLLRLRERLAIGAIDSAEEELVADGGDQDGMHDPHDIMKNAAVLCLNVLPSCLAAVKGFDRDRPVERQRWALAPPISLATVVEIIEDDLFMPLLRQLRAEAESKSKNKRKLVRRLLYPDKESHPLFEVLAEAGAYRSLIVAAQACAASGRDCVNAQLKQIAHIDAPDNYTPYMSALRKWGPGDHHPGYHRPGDHHPGDHHQTNGLSLADRVEFVMSHPFDITLTLPALQLATDVLATRASRKHKRKAGDRDMFVRGKTREGRAGQWELSDMARHIRKVRPVKMKMEKNGKCKDRDCDCDVRTVPGPLTVDKLLLHLVMNQPVLFRNAVPKKLARNLKLSRLVELFGDRKIEIGFTPYPLMHGAVTVKKTFREYVRNVTSFQLKYKHQYAFLMNVTEEDIHEQEVPLYVFLPDFFDDEDLIKVALELGAVSPALAHGLGMHIIQLLMGPAGSGAPPHFHRPALNFVIQGTKRWHLLQPSDSIYSVKPPLAWQAEYRTSFNRSAAQVFECTQRAGDVLFVPQTWTHATYNTELTTALVIGFSSQLMSGRFAPP